ncbi:MAG: STAS domain-containing protein, partial [Wenzhouxiangellaceae bacterium]
GLAAALFIRRMALLTQTDRVDLDDHPAIKGLPADVALYDVNGPLFFGAAEKALSSLHLVDPKIRTVILDMHDVPSMDGTAIVAFRSLVEEMARDRIGLILVGFRTRIIVKLRRAGVRKVAGSLTYCKTLVEAKRVALGWRVE